MKVKRRREVGGLQGGADRVWTRIIEGRTCRHERICGVKQVI